MRHSAAMRGIGIMTTSHCAKLLEEKDDLAKNLCSAEVSPPVVVLLHATSQAGRPAEARKRSRIWFGERVS